MRDYVAWLNGQSVARGTLSHVDAEARKIAATPAYQEWEGPKGITLRITRGAEQLFVKSIILR